MEREATKQEIEIAKTMIPHYERRIQECPELRTLLTPYLNAHKRLLETDSVTIKND